MVFEGTRINIRCANILNVTLLRSGPILSSSVHQSFRLMQGPGVSALEGLLFNDLARESPLKVEPQPH